MSETQPLQPKEGFVLFRWLMVMGSMAPLFCLLAFKGVPKIDGKDVLPNSTFIELCLLLALIPTAIIFRRLTIAKAHDDTRVIAVGTATDSRENLLAYLFALIIPLYQNSYASMGDVWAAVFLLILIMFMFYHLNLHYMNLLFAGFGYRVYTVETQDDGNPFSGRSSFIVLSKRHYMPSGTQIRGYRISDTVYVESWGS